MKNKIKNFTYWLEVAALGIVLGLIIQGARAWTEPTAAPPGGNLGAPINTEANLQTKSGSLELLGQLITSYINVPGDVPAAGDVLTAQNASGQVAWQAGGGGGWYVPSDIKETPDNHNGNFGGYKGMYDWIQDHGCAGYHVCDPTELLRYYQIHPMGSLRGWYMSAKMSINVSYDCAGWKGDGNDAGPLWIGWYPYDNACYSQESVMCCK